MAIPQDKLVAELANFRQTLRSNKLKSTPQRLIVHEAMLNLGHASVDQVVEYINKKSKVSITIASVYNVLSTLAEMGIYSRRFSCNSKMYFDITAARHLHVYDSVNNTYKDIIDNEILDVIDEHFQKLKIRGYRLDGVDLQLICHPVVKQKKSL